MSAKPTMTQQQQGFASRCVQNAGETAEKNAPER